MINLARAIVAELEHEVKVRLGQGSERVQLVFVGPPRGALFSAFELMTAGGTTDWRVAPNDDAVVLFVDTEGHRSGASGPASARCTWDYALSLRLDAGVSVILATREAWDDLPESIENTSEILGAARAESRRPFLALPPWPSLLDDMVASRGLGRRALRKAFGDLLDDGRQLDPLVGQAIPWTAADEVLGGRDLLLAVGLPSPAGEHVTDDDITRGREALKHLAELCGREGFASIENELEDARREYRRAEEEANGEASFLDNDGALRGMFEHLRASAGSGGDFERAPGAYFRLDTPAEWWLSLNWPAMATLLDMVDSRRPKGRLSLTLFPAILSNRLAGEPALVQNDVALQVLEVVRGEEAPVAEAAFARRYPGHSERWDDAEDGKLLDADVPPHDHPITYAATAKGYRQASIKVVSLDNFECKGHARIAEATQNPPPARASRRRGPFEQEITVRRAGMHEIVVYAASEVAQVQLASDGGNDARSGNAVSFHRYLEDGDWVDVILLGGDESEISRWRLAVHVEEAQEGLARSRFADLVESHRDGKVRRRAISARVSQLRDLEQQYLTDGRSWTGLVACWSPSGAALGPVDWAAGTAGDVPLLTELTGRPAATQATPPETYLNRRAALMERISRWQRPVSELDLHVDDLPQIAEEYLSEYLGWLRQDVVAASWTDAVALYVQATTGQSIGLPGTEPAAVLLSPFHPLRLAWHVLAQDALYEALESAAWCPLAGLLNPHGSPSLIALPLQHGQTTDWRPFVSVGSDEVHWSVMLNGRDLGNADARQGILAVLERLGFTPEGPTGGVTAAQARRALNDVTKILPTRATLRLGLVGGTLEASGSVEGTTSWIRETFASEAVDSEEGVATPTRPQGPDALEVFDFRSEKSYPTEASLAMLSEEVGERVRWFGGQQRTLETPQLDLVIFDQVEAANLEVDRPRGDWASRSVLGWGGLYRLNLREDPGAAQWIRQARIASTSATTDGLPGLLERAIVAVESACADLADKSHLRFVPNQQAIADWVGKARFVTATSSQVDPACFIRGSGPATGYLWDYELPGVLESEDRAGYYLIASPSTAMIDGIKANLGSVVDNPPPVDSVLREISRRGIPVLKKLAAEGSHARGEIGVLLAVRFLQDAFREPNSGVRLPVEDDDCIHMILAIDSYREPLDQVRKALSVEGSAERGDLLLVSVRRGGGVRLRLTPVEIKYVATQNELMLPEALSQAENVSKLLVALLHEPPQSKLWIACGRAFMAEALDQCFRVYADRGLHGLSEEEWTRLHQETLDAVLTAQDLTTVLAVNGGRVLAFGGWTNTRLRDMNGDGIPDTAVFASADAAHLLTGDGELSDVAVDAVRGLDFSATGCGEPAAVGPPIESVHPAVPSEEEQERDEDFAEAETEREGEEETTEEVPASGDDLHPAVISRVRDAFHGFVGNENALRQLTRDLVVALLQDPPHLSKNILLQGLPSVGKTELARRIARALGLPFVHLDGPSLASRERLFRLIDGQLGDTGSGPVDVGSEGAAKVLEYPPFVVFVDEVHLVPRAVQESLLTMLEPGERRARLNDRIALVRQATFIFATTRASKLDPAMRSRLNRIDLRPYELGEVAEMVRRRVEAEYGLTWEDDVYLEIARLSRLVPRLAFVLAEDVRNEMIANPAPKSVLQHLDAVRMSKELDENGLRVLDLEYLEALERAGRPLGEDSIANQLGTVDRDEVVDEIEPALLRMRLIERTQGGRVITRAGAEYLARRRFNTPN